jgi:hypothetical protein
MKKILINGCSFVSGDAIVWQDFLKEKNLHADWFEIIGRKNDQYLDDMYSEYVAEYRPKRNLPSLIANKLNTDVVDLSQDGNSNDSISFTTVQYLSQIPEIERKNYHVIIGWTATTRFLKYSKSAKSYYNTNIHQIDYKTDQAEELKNYIVARIAEGYNEDFIFNYIQNIITLENFLKSNNCSYTFYRNLGYLGEFENFKWSDQFLFCSKIQPSDDLSLITNDDHWLKFKNINSLGISGESMASEYLDDHSNRIDPRNGHPNLRVIQDFSDRLVGFIQNQRIGF